MVLLLRSFSLRFVSSLFFCVPFLLPCLLCSLALAHLLAPSGSGCLDHYIYDIVCLGVVGWIGRLSQVPSDYSRSNQVKTSFLSWILLDLTWLTLAG